MALNNGEQLQEVERKADDIENYSRRFQQGARDTRYAHGHRTSMLAFMLSHTYTLDRSKMWTYTQSHACIDTFIHPPTFICSFGLYV